MEIIDWKFQWRAFDAPVGEQYFLCELEREIETNCGHPLYGKNPRIVGWIPYWDDFILYLPEEGQYHYVHLTWQQEHDPAFPHCKILGNVVNVNAFIAQGEE